MAIPAALQQRASELGIETRYQDVDQVWHDADPAALGVVVDALAADEDGTRIVEPVVVGAERPVTVDGEVVDAMLTLADGTTVDVPRSVDAGRSQLTLAARLPYGCHRLDVEIRDARGRSVAAATTVVVAPATMPRVERLHGASGLFVPAYALWDDDAPLPSFRLLGRLARRLPALDTTVLTTLPLYATYLDEPFDPSPYSPVSRLHWSELYVDDAVLPAAPVPPLGRHLDWRRLARRRRRQMLDAAAQMDAGAVEQLAAFTDRCPDVAAFARFLAGRRRGAATAALTRRSHELAQHLADQQLAELAAAASGRRPRSATLAIDLPIGCHPDGYERWAHPELFASGMTIGAPPDTFFTGGQDWGLPPQLPAAGRRSGHFLWRAILERAGEHASLLRIDHVMAVHRLWWIPEGFAPSQGVYVRYPREELLAVIAATAAATGTTVVGEDLGTVPDEVAEALERWDVLGMYEEQFHTGGARLAEIPARSVAGVRTHDMAPFAAFAAEQGSALAPYRRRLGRAIGRSVGAAPGAVLDAILERLAASEASLVTADLDDLVGETEPHNVPGRVLDTNWCRRLERSLSATLADPEIERRLRLLGRRPHG